MTPPAFAHIQKITRLASNLSHLSRDLFLISQAMNLPANEETGTSAYFAGHLAALSKRCEEARALADDLVPAFPDTIVPEPTDPRERFWSAVVGLAAVRNGFDMYRATPGIPEQYRERLFTGAYTALTHHIGRLRDMQEATGYEPDFLLPLSMPEGHNPKRRKE